MNLVFSDLNRYIVDIYKKSIYCHILHVLQTLSVNIAKIFLPIEPAKVLTC